MMKRGRRDTRISELPDDILVHVLSFLPTEDAIRTQILSKEWRFLWTYVPSLLFRQYDPDSDEESRVFDPFCEKCGDFRRGDFVTFVEETLALSNCSKMKKLWFDFEYKPCLASNVNLWTRFAAGNGVEELHLECHREGWSSDMNDCYELPQHLYSNSSFQELHFSHCRVTPKGDIGWKSLKKLSIGNVQLSNDLLQKILLSSPMLEMLELYRCYGVSRLHVNNASLKKLILRNFAGRVRCIKKMTLMMNMVLEDEADGEDNPQGMEISASYLQSLEISCRVARIFRLIDVSSLVDAKLTCKLIRDGDMDDFVRFLNELRGLLSSLVHVNSLTVGGWAMQVLPIMEAKGLSLPLLNCTSLTLQTCFENTDFPGIARMFAISPNLETLVINKPSCRSSQYDLRLQAELCKLGEIRYWTSQKRTFKCLSLHLKKVVFADMSAYADHADFFDFVKFLLKNAKVLQKMIVDTSSMLDDVFETSEMLLSFPKSSPDAVIVFC